MPTFTTKAATVALICLTIFVVCFGVFCSSHVNNRRALCAPDHCVNIVARADRGTICCSILAALTTLHALTNVKPAAFGGY